MNASDDVVLIQLFSRDPTVLENCARFVIGVFSNVLSRVNDRELETDGIVDHAFMALRRRLERELEGKLAPEQSHYGDLLANSEDFRRIAYRFVMNAISDLAGKEKRDRQNRVNWGNLDDFPDPRGIVEKPQERQEEIKARVEKILQICTPAELRVVEEFLKTEDCAQAANNLGFSVNYIHQVLSRIRLRIAANNK